VVVPVVSVAMLNLMFVDEVQLEWDRGSFVLGAMPILVVCAASLTKPDFT
jgi:hypothetical protein